MGLESIKIELIEWLTKLDDKETIYYLKGVKDSKTTNSDWWNDLPDNVRKELEKGMEDVDMGRITSHEDVKQKYGL